MSKMRFDRRPPLAKSPLRLRPRRTLQSNSTSLQTPPGSLTKSLKLNRPSDFQELDLRPEYQTISCELQALANMVRIELGGKESEIVRVSNSARTDHGALFERGRLYNEYSARRNERLKRKKVETEIECKTPYNLGVTVESSKRKTSKKLESLRKSVSKDYSVQRGEATPRYMLRSMVKENKKPPLPLQVNPKKFVAEGERKMGTRRSQRI